jgi:D-alanyl-D-alanine carboxypeptidase/D-alanyl-D-alanine-endopeptidase (penicillin-binding protein 4)
LCNADEYALKTIKNYLAANGVLVSGKVITPYRARTSNIKLPADIRNIAAIQSPSLDSLIYWFLKKSINLYGDALVRKIGSEKENNGTTDAGLEWIDSLYTANGFDKEAMHLYDGSGLSPANRITPFTLTKALHYAKTKTWFPYFYNALPLYNGMKLKSGTINRVKGFAGYHTSKSGNNYIVAIMVNNYNGPHSTLVSKMFTVLDCLK